MSARLLRVVVVVVALTAAAGAADGREEKAVSTDLLAQPAKELPIAFESLYAAALGDRLHVVGLDDARRARRLTIDAGGQAAAAPGELPLVEITGVAACGGALVVTGVEAGDRAVALGLGPDGAAAWRVELKTDERFQHWPRPVCVAGAPWLWSTTRAALTLVDVAGGRLGAARSIALGDDTGAVDVLAEGDGVVVARVHGSGEDRLELVRIAGGRVVARADVARGTSGAPSLAHAGGAIALAWIDEPGRAARLAWFDAQLNPLGAPEALPAPPSAGALAGVGLLAASDGALAIVERAHVIGDAAVVHHPDGAAARRGPPAAWPLWIAAYDRAAHRLAPLHLVDADARLYAGGWLGATLALAHRGSKARVSLFTRRAP